MSDIVFLDTETLGTEIDSPIWELAAIRRHADGSETPLHIFIDHDPDPWMSNPKFPDSFKDDYRDRYRTDNSLTRSDAAGVLKNFLTGRPHIVGAVTNFDTERIAHQILRPNGIGELWNYHLIDIENIIVGFLGGDPLDELPWNSNELSRAIGVDPDRFDRHTALGDVKWVVAQFDAITGGRK